MRKLRFSLLLFCLASASFLPGTSSQAIEKFVPVSLRIAETSYYTPKVVCSVSVREFADGVAVLEAAKTKGCISSYSIEYFSFGAFVKCIDGVCGDPAPTYLRYWVMRDYGPELWAGGPHRCDPTSYGVSDYKATQDDRLSFTFENGATGSLPVTC